MTYRVVKGYSREAIEEWVRGGGVYFNQYSQNFYKLIDGCVHRWGDNKFEMFSKLRHDGEGALFVAERIFDAQILEEFIIKENLKDPYTLVWLDRQLGRGLSEINESLIIPNEMVDRIKDFIRSKG